MNLKNNNNSEILQSLLDFSLKISSLYISLNTLNKSEIIDNFISLLVDYKLISSYSIYKKSKYQFNIFGHKYYYNIDDNIPTNIKEYIIKMINTHSSILEYTFKHIHHQKDFDYLNIANNLIIGMFHEINNPLSVILMKTEMLSKNIDKKYEKDIKLISDNLYKIIEITNLFRSLVKRTEIKSRLNLIDILKSVVKFMRYKAGSKIEINLNYENNSYYIYGNKQELMIVFSNLIENSIEAIQETNKNGIINIQLEKLPTFYIVTIKDNGIGISDKNINRIFEPFFTTKSKRGMGYGLFFVYNICMKHNIEINVESNFKKGTKFILKIPKVKEE
ncbi:hypothetical protein X275_02110 [Marinitoga sp. 1197]|uniref:sensor histidine kinase n=1 Tax=unclassified Marinitoga TaxID=2640159 RepID=UPI000641319B|nr:MULTISPECIES: HAMP domain-containing sensor histidine kinase [unclassified Marinitoga]KLO23643.1 hypothetical protein X275_02110 [Marinitoga sp. 1197]NUV00227.1 hypothetical protein [Marinitoga sp. 1154]